MANLAASLTPLIAASSPLEAAASELAAVAGGATLFVCGNGGSAAQAMHVEAELLGRYRRDRAALPSVLSGASASTSTALGNDYGAEELFARPLRALGRPGDVLLAISTSGTSLNVVSALAAARELGVRSILLTGATASDGVADVVLRVAGSSADAIQDGHQVLIHVLMDVLEGDWSSGEELREL